MMLFLALASQHYLNKHENILLVTVVVNSIIQSSQNVCVVVFMNINEN